MRIEDLHPEELELSPELKAKTDALYAELKKNPATFWKSAEVVRLALRINRLAHEVLRTVGFELPQNAGEQGALMGVVAAHGRDGVEGDPLWDAAAIAELMHRQLHVYFRPGPAEDMPGIVLSCPIGQPGEGVMTGHGHSFEEAAAYLAQALRDLRAAERAEANGVE